jgi:hypothetical protein
MGDIIEHWTLTINIQDSVLMQHKNCLTKAYCDTLLSGFC